ncbi:MAG TPA: ABC transporter permease [Xanthomonadales bacterium]|nr:ABC transporter permease [Xanthomonadales bacterium]
MADARWRKLLRDTWLHRGRLALAVLAMALALAAAGALLATWALVRSATRDGYRASLPASATLAIEPLDDAFVARVRALPGIAAAHSRSVLATQLRIDGTWRQALLFAPDDYAERDMALLAPDGGAWPPPSRAIVVERSSVAFAGARVGDAAVSRRADGELAVPVAGFVRDVSLAPGGMEHVVYGFATPATLRDIDADRTRRELRIRVADTSADRDAVRRIAASIADLATRDGRTVRRVDVPVPGEHIHAAQMDSLLLVQGAFAALALAFAACLAASLVAALFARQLREIGVMKAIGASDAQVALAAFGQALVPGTLATIVALPLALAAGRRYAALKGELLNFPIDTVPLPPWVPLLLVVLGLLLPVLAAAPVLRRVARLGVAEALRDPGIASDGGRIARRLSVPGLPRPLTIALNNAFRRRARLVLTLLALAGGGAVQLAAANLRDAVVGSVDLMFAAQRWDMTLGLSEPSPPGAVLAAAAIPGVARAEAWGRARAVSVRADGTPADELAVLSVPASSTLLAPLLLDGRWPRKAGEIAVTRRVVRDDPSVVPGTTLRLRIDDAVEAHAVVGVVDGGPQPIAYRLPGPGEPARVLAIAATARDELAQIELVARLRASLARAGVGVDGSQRAAENRRVVEDHLLLVVEFLGAMGWLMLAVGALGLASSLALAVLERTREIGVLRAIGARHVAVFGLVQAEGMVVALLAWLVSIPASVPVAVLLGQAFGRVMFSVSVRLVPDGAAVLAWLFASIAIAFLAAALPALRAMRVPAARALAWE